MSTGQREFNVARAQSGEGGGGSEASLEETSVGDERSLMSFAGVGSEWKALNRCDCTLGRCLWPLKRIN